MKLKTSRFKIILISKNLKSNKTNFLKKKFTFSIDLEKRLENFKASILTKILCVIKPY